MISSNVYVCTLDRVSANGSYHCIAWSLALGTCGGDRLDYDGDVTAHTASMETIKCHWNSVLSTPNAKYATGDISNMYLMSLLPDAEFVRFRWDMC